MTQSVFPAAIGLSDLAPKLNLLLGAESLMGRRSGIGRMTLQIAQTLRATPEIASLRLAINGNCRLPSLLDRLDEHTGPVAPPAPPSLLTRAQNWGSRIPGLPMLHAAMLRRRMGGNAAALSEADGNPIIYHEPNMIARPFRGTTVITINDVSWRFRQSLHPPARVAWIEKRLPGSLAQASRYVAVSAFTAREAAAELGLAPERIDVVPLAPSALFRPMDAPEAAPVLARLGLRDRGFILSVSTLEPRKNFDRLLAAHGLLPPCLRRRHPLVIAGGRGWGECLMNAQADCARRRGDLILLGHVADEDLAALYGRCAVFAFVSLYEGFGLSVIEAMAAGAAVVASCTTAVSEVAGDAALQVDPMDEAAMAASLQAVLEDKQLMADRRARALRRAAAFSWDRTASGLIASWRRALA